MVRLRRTNSFCKPKLMLLHRRCIRTEVRTASSQLGSEESLQHASAECDPRCGRKRRSVPSKGCASVTLLTRDEPPRCPPWCARVAQGLEGLEEGEQHRLAKERRLVEAFDRRQAKPSAMLGVLEEEGYVLLRNEVR